MKLRLVLLGVCLAAGLQAQLEMNVQQLVDFIRSELALHQHKDKEIAAYVKKIKLTEKLTDKVILDLEAQGAQPKTVQALQELRDESANVTKVPPRDVTSSPATATDPMQAESAPVASLTSKPAPIPPPDSVRQEKILAQIKEYAFNYTQTLPNFICVEVMRRFIDPTAGDSYRSLGNVLAKVSYNQGQESYRVYSVNGRFEETTLERAGAGGGAVSNGEFGSMMRAIFEPSSEATFGWDHWATIRGRRMAVFNYSVNSGHSNYSISYASGPGDEQRIITAYRGLIYADEYTGEISRITFTAVDIPRSFPVSSATEILDYDLVEIGGQQYVCPYKARLFMTAGREKTKNEIEFRDYRKFGTESTITYDVDPSAPVPPPLPDKKIDEQPIVTTTTTSASPSSSSNSDTNGNTAAKPKPAVTSDNPWVLPPVPPPPTKKQQQ